MKTEKTSVDQKAISAFADEHRAQVLTHLHATGFQPGLLVNFCQDPKFENERIVLTEKPAEARGGASYATANGRG
jgi:GxxExxY protein